MTISANQNVLIPKSSNISVQTSASRIKSSSVLAVKFTLIASAANTKTIYIGDSSVSATRAIPLTAGQSLTFGETKYNDHKSYSYDIGQFWAMATASSQVVTVMLFALPKE
jgi:hypothetical protein